jgi:membrane associated rhomboid family serine protease
MPAVIAGLIGAIAVASILGAVGARNGLSVLLANGVLLVPGVWLGQLWRLVTYPLFETSPWGLFFTGLVLYWFGNDLVARWGERRFLAAFFGLAAAAGAITCLVGRFVPDVAAFPHAGSSAVLDGLIVAWGSLNPNRDFNLYGVVRLTGRLLVPITIGGTVLYSLFSGFAPFVPHFAAELLVLAWLGWSRSSLSNLWRGRRLQRRYQVLDGGQSTSRARRPPLN